MKWIPHSLLIFACIILFAGCPLKYREDLDYSYGVQRTFVLDEFPSKSLVQFESVDWDSENCAELRSLISEDRIAAGRDVLEIGTGTGAIAALCLSYDAKAVVATDTNPAAIANAKYNTATLELDDQLDARQIVPGSVVSFAGIRVGERFGLILVNSAAHPESLVDEAVVSSLLDRLPGHQKSGGRCIVSSDRSKQIERWKLESEQRGFEFKILPDRIVGERRPASMDDQIFPAALLEIRVPNDQLE